VFTFVERFHGMTFREALELLAERSGIELTRRAPAQTGGAPAPERGSSKGEIADANRVAQEFFWAILTHESHGERARAVIERRGIAPEMVEAFGLGATPDRWDGLLRTLESRSADLAAFEDAGLLKARRESGGMYDAFRNRLMFPITEHPTGRVVAFGARKIDEEDEPKYLNSPESAVFSKSRTLYGLAQAAKTIQKRGVAVVVEGYTDVIACHQHGFTNVVGTLGTALTSQHATALRRLCDTVVLLFDADEAGGRAADRAMEVMLTEDLDVRVASVGDAGTGAKDPDELLSAEGGAELFKMVIENARDLLEHRYERLGERLRGKGIAETSRVLGEELATLTSLGLDRVRPLRKRMILRRIGQIAGVDEETVRRAAPVGRSSARAVEFEATPMADAPAPAARTRALTALEGAVGRLLHDPSCWAMTGDDRRSLITEAEGGTPELDAVLGAVSEVGASGEAPGLEIVLEKLDGAAGAEAVRLERAVAQEFEGNHGGLGVYWEDCLASLSARGLSQENGGGGDNDLERLEALQRLQRETGRNPGVRLRGL